MISCDSLCSLSEKRVEYRESCFKEKKTALVTTCAGGVSDNADIICKIFEREAAYLGMKNNVSIIMGLCSTPKEMEHRAR